MLKAQPAKPVAMMAACVVESVVARPSRGVSRITAPKKTIMGSDRAFSAQQRRERGRAPHRHERQDTCAQYDCEHHIFTSGSICQRMR